MDPAADAGLKRSTTARSSGLRPGVLIPLYIGLVLLPVGLAWTQALPARSLWRELSGGLAMAGFAMLLVQFLLSGRFRQVSGQIGIDLTMRFHQLVAWTILVFILAHPLLYAVPRLLSPEPATALISLQRMFTSDGLRTGVVAWALLLLLVPLAVLRDRLPFSYEAWRLSHGLSAAAIAALGLEHTLAVGTYSANPLLAGFWIALAALALGSLTHVYVLKPLLKRGEPYRVVANKPVAAGMWEVVVEPEGGPALDFRPGQFVWLNLGHSAFSLTEHPFSISSIPTGRPSIAFTIKESGDFTDRIGSISLGTRVYLDGPHGSFVLRPASGYVFIAGGVGLAPIMSLLRQLQTESFSGPLHLVYGNRIREQILYQEELDAMTRSLDLRTDYVLAEPPPGWSGRSGQLSPDLIRECLRQPQPDDRIYYLCGPPAMLDSAERGLAELGVPPARIVSERFRYS